MDGYNSISELKAIQKAYDFHNYCTKFDYELVYKILNNLLLLLYRMLNNLLTSESCFAKLELEALDIGTATPCPPPLSIRARVNFFSVIHF